MASTIRTWALLVGLAGPLATGLAGCQAVVDFDEGRICADDQRRPLRCDDPSVIQEFAPGIAIECVSPSCNEQNGACEYPANPGANGMPCDPQDPCVLDATCLDGACVGDSAPEGTVCDDNPCNLGQCNASGECVRDPADPGTACTPTLPNAQCQTTPAQCEQVEGQDPVCIGTAFNDFEPCDNLCFTDATNCFNGECVGTERVECPEGEVCDQATGDCVEVGPSG